MEPCFCSSPAESFKVSLRLLPRDILFNPTLASRTFPASILLALDSTATRSRLWGGEASIRERYDCPDPKSTRWVIESPTLDGSEAIESRREERYRAKCSTY
ncbi:hypothetical protein AA313_de0203226 [Arthrobotrys entomopaga]|nr:hypothetical protein AA313_de0203226 [Arthrobotrys entomopaga]